MTDALFILIILVFFLGTGGLLRLCSRLLEG